MEFNFWVVGAGIFIAIEILSMGLTSIWFGGGAIIAAIAAYNHASFLTQAALFFAVSLISVTDLEIVTVFKAAIPLNT